MKEASAPPPSWIRWVVLLPAALGGALFCCLVAKAAFDKFDVDDLCGFPVSNLFIPVAFTAGFIELAVGIAPKFKFEVCVVFTVLNAMMITIWASHAEFSGWYVGYACLASVATSVMLCIKKKNGLSALSDSQAGLISRGD
jgi:hypothetical protein